MQILIILSFFSNFLRARKLETDLIRENREREGHKMFITVADYTTDYPLG